MTDLTFGDGQDLLERYKGAWETRDVDAAVELYREDAELRLDPFEQPLRGANAIRELWNSVAADQVNVEFDAERIWTVTRTVLTSWHAAATHRATGDRERLRGFTTFELDDAGLIARQRQWVHSRIVGKDSTLKLEGDA